MPLITPSDLQAYSVRQDLKDALRLHAEDPGLVATHVSNSVEKAVRDLVLCASDEDRTAYLATLEARLLDIEERKLLRDVAALQVYQGDTIFYYTFDAQLNPSNPPTTAPSWWLEEVSQTVQIISGGGANGSGYQGSADAFKTDGSGSRTGTLFDPLDGVDELDLNSTTWTLEYWWGVVGGAPGVNSTNVLTDADFNEIFGMRYFWTGSNYEIQMLDDTDTQLLVATPAEGVVIHIAWTRDGDDIALWIGGALADSLTLTGQTFRALRSVSLPGTSVNGRFDECRASRVVRYDAPFTAPSAPFVVD